MSRTYRRDIVDLDFNDKPYPPRIGYYDLDLPIGYMCPEDYFSKRNSKIDHKPFGKSPRWFKKMHGKIRRAKIKEAMIHGRYDSIPCFRRTNDWEWT